MKPKRVSLGLLEIQKASKRLLETQKGLPEAPHHGGGGGRQHAQRVVAARRRQRALAVLRLRPHRHHRAVVTLLRDGQQQRVGQLVRPCVAPLGNTNGSEMNHHQLRPRRRGGAQCAV